MRSGASRRNGRKKATTDAPGRIEAARTAWQIARERYNWDRERAAFLALADAA